MSMGRGTDNVGQRGGSTGVRGNSSSVDLWAVLMPG